MFSSNALKLFTFVAILGALIWFVLLPQINSVFSLQQTYLQEQRDFNAIKATNATMNESIDYFQNRLDPSHKDTVATILPEHPNEWDLYLELRLLMQQAGLQDSYVDSLGPSTSAVGGGDHGLKEISISLVGTGNYYNMLTLLKYLEYSPRIYHINTIILAREEKEPDDSSLDSTSYEYTDDFGYEEDIAVSQGYSLSIQVDATTYFYDSEDVAKVQEGEESANT